MPSNLTEQLHVLPKRHVAFNLVPSATGPLRMKVLQKAVYRGPHFFSNTPMIRIKLDIEELEAWPSDKIPDFCDRLLNLLPGLAQHGCSYGQPGGFERRLRAGTWTGHIVEHIAIELQNLAGMPVTRGKTRSVKGEAGVYNVMFEYEVERAGLLAGYYALLIVNLLVPPQLAELEGLDELGSHEQFTSIASAVTHLRKTASRFGLGPTTKSIVDAATRRGIPAMRLDNYNLVQLGWGKHQRRIRASMTDRTSNIAVETAGDKQLTKELLRAVSVPVPIGDVAFSQDDAVFAAERIGYPVTLKPLDSNHGKGVSTGLNTVEEVRQAFEAAHVYSKSVLIEQHYHGNDFRALVVDGRLVAVAERVPAHIVGDGVRSVQQLIDLVNADPRRGDGHEASLSKIIIDDHVEAKLGRAGLNFHAIPASGKKITLRGTANLSTGGTAIDRTNEIHSENIVLMERAARTVGLDIAGIDVVAESISKPLGKSGGVIEVNAAPGFRMHLSPDEGHSQPVAEAVISMLYPTHAPSRIPLVAITGTNGKSTTVRMVARILRRSGKTVGYTSTSGIYINDALIWEGDASGPRSARRVLADSTVEYAVLETARGGILREGLGFDECDVGVVLNVTEDHLGIGGVNTLAELVAVKSIVTESVTRNGVSVLNADDPQTLAMADHAGGRLCFFSASYMQEKNAVLHEHIEKGSMAVVKEGAAGIEHVVFYKDNQRTSVMRIDEIACAYGGIVGFNVQNALAAVAVATSLNIDARMIKSALLTFTSSFDENPGRFNVHDANGFRTIVDYAHNPAALTELIDVVDEMRGEFGALIGMVSIPGDRRDDDIRRMGRIAAGGFDRLIFRESPDRRGRTPGVVNGLLIEGALSAGFAANDIVAVDTEEEAVDICLSLACRGDVVVLMATDVPGVWARACAYSPLDSLKIPEEAAVLHA